MFREWDIPALYYCSEELSLSKITESVALLVEPIANSMGLTLVEVIYDKKFNGMNLTVVIDKEGGVDINDCENLHRTIDLPLEELNPTDDKSYILNVSSMGLDRALTLPYDFQKNMNKQITVKFYAPVEGKKSFVGTLVDYNEPNFTIEIDGKRITFDRTKTANIAPVIDF